MEYSLEDTRPIEGLDLQSPVSVNFHITNIGDSLLVAGTVSADVRLVCSRCAADYTDHLLVSVDELFLPKGSKGLPEGEEIEAERLCVFTYENNEIEIDEVLRQNLLASLPFRPLCSKDCRGLCAGCGANLNNEVCQCAEDASSDPRWEALAKFRKGSH